MEFYLHGFASFTKNQPCFLIPCFSSRMHNSLFVQKMDSNGRIREFIRFDDEQYYFHAHEGGPMCAKPKGVGVFAVRINNGIVICDKYRYLKRRLKKIDMNVYGGTFFNVDLYSFLEDAHELNKAIDIASNHLPEKYKVTWSTIEKSVSTYGMSAIKNKIKDSDNYIHQIINHLTESHRNISNMQSKIDNLFLKASGRSDIIPESAIRAYLERAISSGIPQKDILAWLPEWIDRAETVFRNGDEEYAIFGRTADKLLASGDISQASISITEELERLELEEARTAEEFRHRKALRIEKSIQIDEIAQNYKAIPEKILKLADIEGFRGDDAIAFAKNKASEWYVEGSRSINPSRLMMARAVNEYLSVLCLSSERRVLGAAVQSDLGLILARIGDRLEGRANIEAYLQSRFAIENALELQDRTIYPVQWANSQSNLGNVLMTRGERLDGEDGIRVLSEARVAFDAASEVYTREDFPHEWARSQNSLGLVLQTLGERLEGSVGIQTLREARIALEAALEIYSRQDFPIEWAKTQNDLGLVVQKIAARLEGAQSIQMLNGARSAHESALEVRTHQDFPVDWSMTQNNLGVVLQTPGARLDGDAGIQSLSAARTAYEAALEVRNRKDFPVDWAMTQNNLGIVLGILGERLHGDAGIQSLNAARRAYDAALEVRTRKDFPVDWALTQENIAILCESLYDRTTDASHLEDGISAAEGALEVYRTSEMPYYVNKSERLLAHLKAKRP